MKTLRFVLFIVFTMSISYSNAQQTVGLFLNSKASYDGYTLFSPLGSKTSYLINNCGEKIQTWNSTYRPGQSAYLLENGYLLRTGNNNNSTFIAGGQGGVIELLDWQSKVVWSYIISSNTEFQHHDVEYLPNGNILAIVWDSKTNVEATQAGRTSSGQTLWSEKIIEIKPDLINGGGSIVWEWKVWDHLVQDVDITKDNFGDVANSPQLININYFTGNSYANDWLHVNSIDYNAKLDQIVISNHNFSEIWIIDHSTTTTEALSHSGGKYNKGGDLLYRWGNPQAYNKGVSNNQQLFKQHNANWIDDSLTDGGMIMVFNNQAGNSVNYSTVEVIDPPLNPEGSYEYNGAAFLPTSSHWTYKAEVPTDFYSNNISGATRLTNGNTLICSGSSGMFFEVDYDGKIVWKYINPVSAASIIKQGSAATNNLVFRAERYGSDFKGFYEKDMTPKGYIESGSNFTCELFSNDTATVSVGINNYLGQELNVFPNPAISTITITSHEIINNLEIYNLFGEILMELYPNDINIIINISKLADGIYFINSKTNDGTSIRQKFIVNRK